MIFAGIELMGDAFEGIRLSISLQTSSKVTVQITNVYVAFFLVLSTTVISYHRQYYGHYIAKILIGDDYYKYDGMANAKL